MVAAVTDLGGTITGAHRSWVDPSGRDKVRIDTPRRAMGHRLGNAVRFGMARDVVAAGEGDRDHGVAPLRHALHANGSGALGRASGRGPVPPIAAPPLHRS